MRPARTECDEPGWLGRVLDPSNTPVVNAGFIGWKLTKNRQTVLDGAPRKAAVCATLAVQPLILLHHRELSLAT